jgi:hypothetical protein
MAQFLELALPFIRYRIPMFPLQARPADGEGNPEVAKQPWQGLGGWQLKATSSPELLMDMNRNICHEQPANCALVARAEPGGFCFWEFDGATVEQACAEASQPRPVTLEQRSGRGGCHLVFRHTPRSIELGNRDAKGSDRHELWSFRADNRYLVAAGSTHPNGSLYRLVRDCEPVPVPDWVVDYIASHGNADRPKPNKGDGPSLDAGFEFADFLDHYGLAVDGKETDGWNTLSECPAVGRRHLGNGTAIYHDGESLHWSCLADGCDLHGKTMGEVIRWLNTEGGFEPYPGRIWEEQSDEEFCEAMGIEMACGGPGPQEAGPASSPRDASAIAILGGVGLAEAPREEEPEPAPGPAPPPVPQQPEPAPPVPVESRAPGLEFPEAALYGRLGELARGMRMPLGLAYPALLACYSVVPNADEMCGVRINLYTALVARKGGGKNTAIRRARESLWIAPESCSKFAAGGDTQLCVALGDRPKVNEKGTRDGRRREPGPRKMLLLNNEISEMLKKSGIDASTLADRLCDFYDDNEFQKMVRGEMVRVDCRISWLGGIPATVEEPDRFRELFGAATNDGLYERFVFGYEGGRRFKYGRWEPPPPPPHENRDLDEDIATGVHGCTLVQSVRPGALALKDEWVSPREGGEGNTRLEFLLLKVAILTASANDEEEVSVPCMRAAIAFLEWQGRLKEVFQVGMAKNLEAEFDAMAIDAIQRLNEKTGTYVNWRRLRHDRKWDDRYGASNVSRWMEALLGSGGLICLMRKDEEGKPEKVESKVMTLEYARRTGRVRDIANPNDEGELP